MKMILLAAGLSRRAGGRQKLVRLYNGRPLVAYSLEAALAAADVIVVTGHESDAVRKTVLDLHSKGGFAHTVEFAHNAAYADGQLGSAFCGLEHIGDEDFAFMLSDTPGVTADFVCRLKDEFGRQVVADVLRPVSGGIPCHPVFFRAVCRKTLLEYRYDKSVRSINDILKKETRLKIANVAVDEAGVADDVDTAEFLDVSK